MRASAVSERALCGGRQQFSALPLGCGGGLGPLPWAAGVWKAGRRGRSAWWENMKHDLALFRSLPQLTGNLMPSLTQFPVSFPGQFLRSAVLGVRRRRLPRRDPLHPPKLAEMDVGARRGRASLTVSLTEQGKGDACFSCF